MVSVNKTSRCMARARVSPSTLRYVHPAFRRFLIRREIRHRLGKKNISLAARIRNRWLRYTVLPRAAPFLCSTCGFATAYLKKIKEHACLKKSSSVNDFERDIKVAQMGVRGSRCKDAMAVLERMSNPQSVRLPKFHIISCEPSTVRRRVSTLSTLAYDSLKKFERPMFYPTRLLYDEVLQCSTTKSLSSEQPGSSASKVALHCTSCRELFYGDENYEKHLQGSDCSTKSNGPIIVELDADSTIPVEYSLGRRISKWDARNRPNLRCTICQTNSNELETVGDFHEHIMKCAGRLPNDAATDDGLQENLLSTRAGSLPDAATNDDDDLQDNVSVDL